MMESYSIINYNTQKNNKLHDGIRLVYNSLFIIIHDIILIYHLFRYLFLFNYYIYLFINVLHLNRKRLGFDRCRECGERTPGGRAEKGNGQRFPDPRLSAGQQLHGCQGRHQ